MNSQTRRRRFSSSAVIATAGIALFAIAPLTAFADPPAAQTPRALESKVSLSDLDLFTPGGLHAAQKRLKGKAEFLCRQLWDGASAAFRWTYAACVKETLANAIQQLNPPTFAVAERLRSDP